MAMSLASLLAGGKQSDGHPVANRHSLGDQVDNPAAIKLDRQQWLYCYKVMGYGKKLYR